MLHGMAKKEKQNQKKKKENFSQKTKWIWRQWYSDTLYVFPTIVLASILLWKYILLTISLLKYSFFCFNDEAMKTDGYYILKMFLFVKVKKSATQWWCSSLPFF